MIANCSSAAPKKDSQPANDVRMQIRGQQAFQQKGVAHPIKGLGQVSGGHHSAGWRFMLIEAARNHSGEGKEGGDRGTARAKAMLEGSLREREKKERAEEALKDFRGRAKKGNRAIGGA